MCTERRYIYAIYLDDKPFNCFHYLRKKPSRQEKDTEKQTEKQTQNNKDEKSIRLRTEKLALQNALF